MYLLDFLESIVCAQETEMSVNKIPLHPSDSK